MSVKIKHCFIPENICKRENIPVAHRAPKEKRILCLTKMILSFPLQNFL